MSRQVVECRPAALPNLEIFEQFRNAMTAAGICAPEKIEADGKLRRFASNGKKSDDAGWYVLHNDGIPAGAFGDHRTGVLQNWRADIGRPLTHTEDAQYRKQLAATRKAKAQEDERRRAKAAKHAQRLWAAAAPAGPDHPYLIRKDVRPSPTLRELHAKAVAEVLGYTPKSGGSALAGRILVAPLSISDSISTCELIDETGRKSAIYGGAKSGGYWATQAMPGNSEESIIIFIAEGVATAITVATATNHLCVSAMSASNLRAVTKALHHRYPSAKLILAADLEKATGNAEPQAISAATAIGGICIYPNFGDARPPTATDFNDMAIQFGISAVTEYIDRATTLGAVNMSLDLKTGDTDSVEERSNVQNKGIEKRTCKYGGGTFEVSPKGVFFVGVDKDGNERAPQWICSQLDVVAQTRDAKSSEWGRLLQWLDDDQVQHQWAMPLELLQSDGTDVRRELARMGLTIAPSKAARDLLSSYIQAWPVKARARCVERLGWQGNVYVSPTESIGQDAELVVFQNVHAIEPAFSTAGTVGQWRNSVAALAAGNSRLVFALSVALAGPLAEIGGEDSGGFHLRGASSSGKTTALKAAASVWGSPNDYPRLWRATANGLEGLAALHNDGLLILDELSQVDPREAGEAAYLLANGQGKARASRSGTARQPARWRVLFLSAGEESLTALMARVGKKVNAGQEIRLADIDADAGAGMGAFETLHTQPTPTALALAVKDAANRWHGAVGVAWLRCLVKARASLPDDVEDGIKQFVENSVPLNSTGQVLRVARRFGLVAVAGELATHYGLTGWPKGESIQAATNCFAAWLDAFGGAVNREERTLLSQVRSFFEAHGASRFEDILAPAEQRPVINRAGFTRPGANGLREFLVFPESFRNEVCAGADFKTAVATLVAAGWLQPGNDGRTAQKPRIPGHGPTRCYVFTARMWEDD